jgi:tRNA threonylcarbamoyladenosine biosynthesis protein TsaB
MGVAVLGIDTSAAACSAALWRDGAVAAAERREMRRGHAEALMPMIERVMATADADYRRLAAVAVVAGPGAFTGLRIGLAAARGLALAASVPAIGISAFAAIAAGVPAAVRGERALAIAIDTKRGDVYLQCFDAALAPVGAPRVAAAAELTAALPQGPLCVAGDGSALVGTALVGSGRDLAFASAAPPDAAVVAALGAERLAGGARPLPAPEPIYLRAPEATPLALQGKAKPGAGAR